MKSQELASVLRSYAEALGAAGARPAKDQVKSLATIFDVAPASKVSDVVKRMKSTPALQAHGTPDLGNVAHLLEPLGKLLGLAAKASVAADIDAAMALLREHSSTALEAFVKSAPAVLNSKAPPRRSVARAKQPLHPLRDDLVADYLAKLEARLGDDELFAAVYKDLSSNSEIGSGELAALAKRFAGASVRSKDAALKKIWARHQSLMAFKAKARATGGRSAA